MKELTVNGQVVVLNMEDSTELTPSVVKQALRVAFGNIKQHANVSDGSKAYRVTPSRIRLMTATEEAETFGF